MTPESEPTNRPLRVLFVSSEINPYASTGGLADVCGALPGALNATGEVVVERIMPLYRMVQTRGAEIASGDFTFSINLLGRELAGDLKRVEGDPVTTWLVNREEYFDRTQLYGLAHRDFDDNLERFLFFQWAVIRWIEEQTKRGQGYDIVHCHDWQAGLIPWMLKSNSWLQAAGDYSGRKPRSVFTIHNLAYQGQFPGHRFWELGLPGHLFGIDGLEFYGDVNWMKGGLTGADALTTVSDHYAQEIQEPENGCGLHGLLQSKASRLSGIVNGIDLDDWNPAKDKHIEKAYSAGRLTGKAACKEALQKEAGLPVAKEKLLIGMVTRLAEQKGLDLFEDAMERLVAMGVQIVLLGTGDQRYEQQWSDWAKAYPEHIAAWIKFDLGQAHRIEAGADAFLMPSRFEPCGLSQMYSMRYGTLPIVNPVGGLADTVDPIGAGGSSDTSSSSAGTGFYLSSYTADGLVDAVEQANHLYTSAPKLWRAAVKRGMNTDLSWDASAKKYLAIYRDLIDQG